MPDNADPIAPEDRPATQRDVATAIAAAEERIVDRLTEVMRDMQTEILKGLQAFAKAISPVSTATRATRRTSTSALPHWKNA
jgi:hypothetical protein